MENTKVGPFLIIKKLGNRRHKVYHARQTEQDRDVALKFISIPPTIPWAKALDKIDREVSELQKLRHPNLVQVYGAGVDDQKIFFASELIEGESLASILARRGKLAPDLVVEYGHQISEFLRYLHGNDLVHSKLTPEKLLITPEHRVKVTDLRLNRSKRRRWDSTRRKELDLAAYMAPEQFTEGATAKSDFYSLGVILFEMLTGKLPYQPDTMGRMTEMKKNAPIPSVATHVMNCPIWLDKIVTQMLDPDPRKRPHTARAISFAFEEIKKIDSTKKAAVAQMTSGFNPLTAGEDKSEARRLLGIKKPKKKNKSNDLPFYQRGVFQAVALFLIIVAVIPFLIPESYASRVAAAKELMVSDNPDDWRKAREKVKTVMENEGPEQEAARDLYFESRRKSLVRNAENGLSNRLQSEVVQSFGKAVRLEQDEDLVAAADIYADLVSRVDPDGKERHVYLESKSRLKRISGQQLIPTELGALSDLIAKSKNAQTIEELDIAHEVLSRIARKFVGVEGYEQIVETAGAQIVDVREKIAQLSPTAPKDSQSDFNPESPPAEDELIEDDSAPAQ